MDRIKNVIYASCVSFALSYYTGVGSGSIVNLIFLGILYYIFQNVGFVGNKASDLINDFFDFSKIVIENFLSQMEVSDWIISMVCNGIITGVGSVVSFLPQLAVLFLCISYKQALMSSTINSGVK